MTVLLNCVAIGVLLALIPLDVRADDPIEAIRYLQNSRSDTLSWNLTGSRTTLRDRDSKTIASRIRSQQSGDLTFSSSTSVEMGKQKTTVLIHNPKYCGTLARIENGSWSLTALYLSSDPRYNTHLRRTNPLFLEFQMPPFSLLLDEITTGVSTANGTDPEWGDAYAITPGPPHDTGAVRPQFKDIVVNVRHMEGHTVVSRLTTRLEVKDRDPIIQTRQTFEFADWKVCGKDVLPLSIRKISENLDPENMSAVLSTSITERKFDLSKMSEPMNEEECWLTFYNIPEPEGTQQNSLMRWVLVVAACVGIAVCVKVLKPK